MLMRKNFTLARSDTILNIRNELLTDVGLADEFKIIMSDSETAEVLWGLLVQRVSNLHGTELASRLTSNLASSKRNKQCKAPNKPHKRTLAMKFEQLRAAKRRKKLERQNEIDLTLDEPEFEMSEMQDPEFKKSELQESEPQVRDIGFSLGDTVSVLEGTGSATQQWSGNIVEIDHYCGVVIVLCTNVPHYPHGYNMVIPFNEISRRINQSVHSVKRKRKKKIIQSM